METIANTQLLYDINGVLKTKIFSKPTDTHAYLPPCSCHPIHTCESIPDTVARRLKKLNSEVSDYEAAKPVYKQYLLNRGYSEDKIDAAFLKYDLVDRKTLYMENPHTHNKGKTFPLTTEFNPKLLNVSKVLQKHKYVLKVYTLLTSIIPPQKIFAFLYLLILRTYRLWFTKTQLCIHVIIQNV